MKKLILIAALIVSGKTYAQTEVMENIGMAPSAFKMMNDNVVYESNDTLLVEVDKSEFIYYISVNNVIDHAIIIRSLTKKTETLAWLEGQTKMENYYFYELDGSTYGMFLMEFIDPNFFGLFVAKKPE